MDVQLFTLMLVQLASFILASWVAGVNELVLPNCGDITGRLISFIGVLLNEKARVTCVNGGTNEWGNKTISICNIVVCVVYI